MENTTIFEVPNGTGKICPLFALKTGTKFETCLCIKHLCAWYNLEWGECSIKDLANNVGDLIGVLMDDENNLENNEKVNES